MILAPLAMMVFLRAEPQMPPLPPRPDEVAAAAVARPTHNGAPCDACLPATEVAGPSYNGQPCATCVDPTDVVGPTQDGEPCATCNGAADAVYLRQADGTCLGVGRLDLRPGETDDPTCPHPSGAAQ